ncbi:MAG: helix-turn-helix domain-containing protein [Firmicutes bacterium]|nr:helix-turn-helix domain-containing protein [Bacillota bacterium]
MREFAKRLKELRKEKELSIFELSKEVDISVGAICYWENGKSDIKSDQILILADFFKVTADYLLGRTDIY